MCADIVSLIKTIKKKSILFFLIMCHISPVTSPPTTLCSFSFYESSRRFGAGGLVMDIVICSKVTVKHSGGPQLGRFGLVQPKIRLIIT